MVSVKYLLSEKVILTVGSVEGFVMGPMTILSKEEEEDIFA